ncbi:MAG: KH domain-containing protein [Desulfovibrio sp.]|uniref:protein jag n=1 Tax=Desulfovibrio sp. TaxID=885 RepID=UPI00135D7F5A|nr:protein jag [Desulfovibrio sp.]MTJ94277.1 KH domain-containing protein [Desulfovibrio sp.]
MEGFKEFQGKDLDGAIEEACGYFNTAREKLEIEIVQDAKSGIFGIVGARKAKVRARRVQLRETVESILGRKGGDGAAVQTASQTSAQASGQAAGDNAPAEGEQRKNGGRQAPVTAVSAPAAEAAAEPAQKAAEAPAEKGRDENRDRSRQDSRGADQRGQDQRSNEGRPPRGQQDDRRNRGRNRNKPPSLDSYESEEALDAACNGNVLEKPADKPFDRRNDRNGKQDRNGNKPSGRNGRNDRRERAGRNAEGDEAVESGNVTEAAQREPRGRRNDSRAEGRNNGNGRGDARAAHREGTRPERAPKTDAALDGLEDDFEAAGEGLPVTPLEQLDAAKLEALVDDTVRKLIRPITGDEVGIAVKIGGGRVYVGIECDEDSGLLIGREGQTLAALQYMISRIVSRGMNAAVRVQLDAGEYRRRQDEKLREMALALAEKVRQSGRSYSTRPLSSYHRRIVHVCLQEAVDVQTRSTGDGPMKRVVIMRKKGERA